ncbi:MAG: hypothetical protein ABFD51_03330, partial [Anaerolineaceae bacterium]
ENERHERYLRQDNERQYRNELEMERHERELQRREDESWQEWNDRAWLENQRHEEAVRQIEIDVLAMFLD